MPIKGTWKRDTDTMRRGQSSLNGKNMTESGPQESQEPEPEWILTQLDGSNWTHYRLMQEYLLSFDPKENELITGNSGNFSSVTFREFPEWRYVDDVQMLIEKEVGRL